MSTAAYITALSIGMFAVLTVSANAAQETSLTETVVPTPVVITDPLVKYKGVKSLTDVQLVELLDAVGFKGKQLKVAWAIAMKESGGRPVAHNKNANTGDNSYGLFQINMIGNLGPARLDKFSLVKNTDLFDPVVNAQVAFHMSRGGEDWGSWGLGPNSYKGTAGQSIVDSFMLDFPKSTT
jgi:hypothetical protein